MRKDLFLWCMDRFGIRPEAIWHGRGDAPKTALLWSPKAVMFGVQYMLQAGDITEDVLMKIAVASMCRNTKLPLVELVYSSRWTNTMRKYRVNITNLYSKGRAHRYRWWESDKQLEVIRYAAKNDLDGLRQAALQIYREEYEMESKKHKIRRYLDERFSPEQATAGTAGKCDVCADQNPGDD